MIEWYQMCQSDNGSITEEHALRKWSVNYMQALETSKDPRAPMQIQTWLKDAGMTNVESRMIPIPLCAWSNGESTKLYSQASFHALLFSRLFAVDSILLSLSVEPRERQIGDRLKAIIGDTLRSHSLLAFTKRLSMSIRDFDHLVSQATNEAVNPGLKAYFPLYASSS